uniref:C-type lectin domain-containing protein n=1 Tax=Acrobeloides nanus TaxID=290746 RepID=A0A914DKZ0_9BILA
MNTRCFLSIFFILLNLNFISTICPKGTIEGFDPKICYKFFGAPTDFLSANITCQIIGGNLASINSAFINEFISQTLKDSLADPTIKTWIGGTKIGSTWTWIDGNPFSYKNWAKGQPSSGNCASIDPSQSVSNWYSNDCQTNMPYICEVSAAEDPCSVCPTTTSCPVSVCPTVSPIPVCRHGYSYFSQWNSCYKYVNAPLNFEAAENYCINEGGYLTSIHSPDEQEYIDTLSHQYGDGPYQAPWIGLRDTGNDLSLPFWFWTDNTETTYSNWYPGYPTNGGGDSGCGDMITSGSPWNNGKSYWENDNNCDQTRPFICKQAPICGSG